MLKASSVLSVGFWSVYVQSVQRRPFIQWQLVKNETTNAAL